MTIDDTSDGVRVISREFPGTPDQVAQLRRMLRRHLTDAHPSLDDAELLSTETATNAIKHTKSGRGGSFTVTLWHTPTWLRVNIRDDGGETMPRVAPTPPLAEHGRGFHIIDSLATRWGFVREGSQTEVWFELDSSGRSPGETHSG